MRLYSSVFSMASSLNPQQGLIVIENLENHHSGRYLQPKTLADAENLILSRVQPLGSEVIPVNSGRNRVLASSITSSYAIPQFDRSAMDGFAVRSEDVMAASIDRPIQLRVVGRSLPNNPYIPSLLGGEAVQITTGAPLPAGADAVAIQEAVKVDLDQIRLPSSLTPWTNVSRAGEDIKKGELLFEIGRVLRPQDLGVLTSIGIAQVEVTRRPRVSIFVTGNEVLPCGSQPTGFQIVDSSSTMLRALIERDGGVADSPKHLSDNLPTIEQEMCSTTSDLIIITGGTSLGVEDYAPMALRNVGELLVHGVQLRPARPIGFGLIHGRPVYLLPGNPLSCLCAYDLLVRLALQQLASQPLMMPYPRVALPLGQPLSSVAGRVDYVRVVIRDNLVIPVKHGPGSGASVLSAASRADGFVLVAAAQTAVSAFEVVDVNLYDG
ncbi:MAG: uncharacterized protein JWP89_4452 [Schlesneria sp.]|nr:uncharacterized protein [Schlesneria sp.]